MNEHLHLAELTSLVAPVAPVREPVPATTHELEKAVDDIVADCFFTVGQVIGTRMTVDFDVVIWWRDHYRTKFLGAMHAFGNRWLQDRQNVTGVGMMLGERAVRYAGARDSIDLESAMRAAADVERYCKLHARRAARTMGHTEGDQPRIAGYWCDGY